MNQYRLAIGVQSICNDFAVIKHLNEHRSLNSRHATEANNAFNLHEMLYHLL